MDPVLLALGSPRRREILELVSAGERSAGELHRALGDLTFGAVSQHLGVLERAGLVSVRREGRRRLYSARPAGLAGLRGWLESMWDEALDRLQEQAEREETGSRPRGRRAPARAGRGRAERATGRRRS